MGVVENSRTAWAELPDDLRRAVESVLGGRITEAVTQSNGFSPGSADRVVTETGRRGFVKAVSGARNQVAFELHRRELKVMSGMPAVVRAPRLVGSYVENDWVALILEDVAGRHPGEALDGSDVGAVLDALGALPMIRGTRLRELPEATVEVAAYAVGWSEIVADGAVADLPEWVCDNLERLRVAANHAGSVVAGDHLVHLDCRADNVLIDGSGLVWIIDWPAAGIGANWFDGLTYLLDARFRGETIDADGILGEHALFAGVPASSIDAALAGITGTLFNRARHPAPPNMPTIREFQLGQALVGAEWLRERWGA
jgi:aminoglycoside phosphotransferase (APT) family kinase protein